MNPMAGVRAAVAAAPVCLLLPLPFAAALMLLAGVAFVLFITVVSCGARKRGD